MIRVNPFTSKTFTNIWAKHFLKNAQKYRFDFFEGIAFFKNRKKTPVFSNLGKHLTKGISYQVNLNSGLEDIKNKAFLIYDVPEYFKLETAALPPHFKLMKIRQYTGFITRLECYKNFAEYFQKTFSKKSRYKFKSYQRNLENCFDVRYVHYFGDISKQEYDTVFDAFYNMLKKRFDDKSEANNNLEEHEWNFYYDSAYELILEKKASLFVIYEGKKPIAISLNYLSEDILFFAMTSFDIDYYKFNLGKIHLMELFKWCFENNIKIFDFSKGYYDYKERWGDTQYNFEYHIFYDSKSVIATASAKTMAAFFRFKQYVRDKELTQSLNKFKHRLRPSKTEQTDVEISEIEFPEFDQPDDQMEKIKLDERVSFLNRYVYDFLYLSNQHISNFALYKLKNSPKTTFIFKGDQESKAYEMNSA